MNNIAQELEEEIGKINSTVTRNRMLDVAKRCATTEEFMTLSHMDFLRKYREGEQGKTAKYDLGPVTYRLLDGVQAALRKRMAAVRKIERTEAEKRENAWFTREDIELVAAFMGSFKVGRIDMRTMRELLGSMVREDEQKTPPEITTTL